ncbi:glycosyltransferase family 31 protein [Cercospora zeae-maydis SCOH1-5]|uniref:Glycosyltransferase family 31 protein n=1 Tax=Cercospora zeae-maydis SCOH1-5 TaxID=717836 RepID=A0A6A6FNS7_9PEZI|nr:glycosyltransferase family 31 protein [Cercospora zeae-maydis SCOH1-5]
MLGVATSMKRIEESLPTFSRWLSHTGSPLLVLLSDQTDLKKVEEDILRTNTQAEALGIELIFEPYHPTFEHDSEGLKNFALATAFDRNRREETKWFGIIDDDTFFLSLRRVLDNLGPYDPRGLWYIGGLTEGHTRVSNEGFKAWGGAGFFISPPLMQILADNAVECTRLDRFFGDLLWRDCIQEVTSPTVHLTEMRGLNQIDLWKDISGWYEAGFNPILTIHHWKSWHIYPVAVGHIVADVAGPDSFLQRYKFGNHTVFTNGFSIAEYPYGLPDLNHVELTMTEDVNVHRPPGQLEFHHSFGHTRPKLELGRDKIQWKFEHAVKTSAGVVRQFYVKKENDDKDVSIIEIDWRHVG